MPMRGRPPLHPVSAARRRRTARRMAGRLAPVLLLLASGACAPRLGLPPWSAIEEPQPRAVESVVYLIGDAGAVPPGTSPMLAALRRDVERWSGALSRDSSVVVLFLGDNVYPAGVHEPGTPAFATDSALLSSQTDVVSGPQARRHAARAFFVAGNHDWGRLSGAAGVSRLENEDSLLDRIRRSGPLVQLAPEAGSPGPAVVDVGLHMRMLLLDTAWWLYEQNAAGKDSLISEIEGALRSAGRRSVLLASHHPYMSSGAHGGLVPFWQTLGLEYLLYKTGSLLQDLNSVPYKELLRRLRQAFASVRRPLLYVGGHDHSLQAFVGPGAGDPYYALVSGSASKLTPIGRAPNMRFRASQPGFMRLVVRRDGHIDLFVLAVPAAYQHCPTPGAAGADTCMRNGLAKLQTLYSTRLR